MTLEKGIFFFLLTRSIASPGTRGGLNKKSETRPVKKMKEQNPIKFIVCGEAQTMEWLLLLFLFFFLLALLLYYRIYARYRKTYKNKSVDTSEIRYCAKFQASLTSIFANKFPKTILHFL